MGWQHYQVAFRLHSPLHVGYRRAGNLMQTRPYLPGKITWAALTAGLTPRLERQQQTGGYQQTGGQVKEHFRFGYLWPAVAIQDRRQPLRIADLRPCHFWDTPSFDYDFLSSHVSTALDYDLECAAEASLHEVEYIAPFTRRGEAVYLLGDLWVNAGLPQELAGWQSILGSLQLGGERGYGWGRASLALCTPAATPVDPSDFAWQGRIPAHLKAETGLLEQVEGRLEPFGGWEMHPDGELRIGARQITFAPGARLRDGRSLRFQIEPDGLWRWRSNVS